MSFSGTVSFDNGIVRSRGNGCLVSTVAPPFLTGYWPDKEALFWELGLKFIVTDDFEKPDIQKQFLTALADKTPETMVFRPDQIGFKWRPTDIYSREEFRASQFSLTFLGNCSDKVLIGALDALIQKTTGNPPALDLQFKQWDALCDWQVGKERLNDVLNHLQANQVECGSLTFYSDFKEVPADLWEYIYDWPEMQVGWVAADLAGCSDLTQFDRYRHESISFKNLENLSNKGIFPHILLPATKANTKILPQLVSGLSEVLGDGTIEIIPAPMINECQHTIDDAPLVEDYTAALMAIYRDTRIPMQMIAPQSWVADRINSNVPLISSSEAAGASLVVLANGDIYTGENAIGQNTWCLGNILNGEALRWERLDAMPEAFSNSTMPEECKACDWRYRCGGVDSSVLLLKERANWQTLFQLYCAPRKALFEEMLWDSVVHACRVKDEHLKGW